MCRFSNIILGSKIPLISASSESLDDVTFPINWPTSLSDVILEFGKRQVQTCVRGAPDQKELKCEVYTKPHISIMVNYEVSPKPHVLPQSGDEVKV